MRLRVGVKLVTRLAILLRVVGLVGVVLDAALPSLDDKPGLLFARVLGHFFVLLLLRFLRRLGLWFQHDAAGGKNTRKQMRPRQLMAQVL